MLQSTRRRLALWLLLGTLPVVLGACGMLGPGDTSRPAIDPRFLASITAYYNTHAAEPGCPAPQILAFSALSLMNSFTQTNTVRLRGTYTFIQFAADGTTDCQGAGDRYFTLFRSTKGPKVVSMTGPTRPS